MNICFHIISLKHSSVKKNRWLVKASVTWSSSCWVIQAEILASCTNISTWKGVLSPWVGFFYRTLSNWTFFCFSLSSGQVGARAQTGVAFPNVISCFILLGVWSYYRKYCLPDRVPTSYVVTGCVTKVNFSSLESLREATVTASSSCKRKMTLQVLPLRFGRVDSHC